MKTDTEYPCNECGVKKGWSIFCSTNDPLIKGYEVLDPTFEPSELDGFHIISYYPLADKSYKTVMVVRVNGSGVVEHVEKLK